MELSDPIIWRGIERILIILTSALLAVLGYKLYIKGLSGGENSLQVDSKLLKFVLSGQGPGLLFMAFGALIMIWAISFGQAQVTQTRTVEDPRITQLLSNQILLMENQAGITNTTNNENRFNQLLDNQTLLLKNQMDTSTSSQIIELLKKQQFEKKEIEYMMTSSLGKRDRTVDRKLETILENSYQQMELMTNILEEINKINKTTKKTQPSKKPN